MGTTRRSLYDKVTWAIVRRLAPNAPMIEDDRDESYAVWRRHHVPDDAALAALRQVDVRGWPSISVLLVDNGNDAARARSKASLDAQVYAPRELCVGRDLASAAAEATGDCVALLAAGDELAPDALFRYAEALHQGQDVVYGDEDRVDGSARYADPFFKPDWSPELLTSMDYIGHAFAARRRLVEEVGGDDAYDLALRLAEREARIGHVPRVLYHVGRWATYDDDRARRALEAAMARRALRADVTTTATGRHRVRYAVEGRPRIAIIIPTRDRLDLLRTTIDSILDRSTYDAYEIIVVDNGSREPATLHYLAELPAPHRVLRDPRPFNWSALNNAAAATTDAPFLLFLNNDVEVITPDWLESLLEHAQRPEVGAVGCKLLYPDGKLQHAGVILGIGGLASHAFRGRIDDGGEYRALSSVVREFSAVTGACLMVRRDVFTAAGGFDEELGVAYNDVDLCLRLHARGLRNVYTPWAQLFHYESATRGPGHPPENEALFVKRWHALIARDPFYNPNLSLRTEQYELRQDV